MARSCCKDEKKEITRASRTNPLILIKLKKVDFERNLPNTDTLKVD